MIVFDSRRAFLEKMTAFALSASLTYERPEVKFLSLAQLDENDPNAKSFEDVSDYNHSGNHLPSSTSNPSRYWHIFRLDHGMADDKYWAPKVLETVRNVSRFLGETLRGTAGTSNQRMYLGYETILDDGRQLWAYVEKISGEVLDAGINAERRAWDPSHGFISQMENFMNCAQLTYHLMWKTLQTASIKNNVPYFKDGELRAIGRFIFFGELNKTWTDGSSVDPSIYEGFEAEMAQRGLLVNATSKETLAFVKEYLVDEVNNFDDTGCDSDDALLEIFEKGITDEEWKIEYDNLARGLVVL